MNKRIYIISLIFIWFILNILLYLVSSNYRYFLQSLKYDDFQEYNINDDFKISIKDLDKQDWDIDKENDKENSIFAWLSNDFWDDIPEIEVKKEDSIDKIEKVDELDWNLIVPESKVEYKSEVEEIKLTKIEENILSSFQKYDLKQVDLHSRLFDLTWEYPDKYFEYYNEDINLYFFWNKIYSDLRDIFEVLTYELPFVINEVNNFWTNSFYINLNDWFDDGYVRIVLEKSNRLFWIKIKKELYSQIKNELATVFAK